MKIYETNEYPNYRNGTHRYEYWLKDNLVTKIKVSRSKFFDGKENAWDITKNTIASWKVDSVSLPEWLKEIVSKIIK